MNHIARIDVEALPRMSQVAEATMMRIKGGALTEPLPLHVQDAARRVLPAYEARARPADAETWKRFLLPVAMAVRNPPSADDVRRFAHTCASALSHIPACCLGPANQRAASREFEFWPAVADLAKLLELDAREVQADVAALRRMSEAPLLPAFNREPETLEERAEQAERNQRVIHELKDEATVRERAERPAAATKPNHISTAHRIKEYRRMGQHDVADAIARHYGLRTDAGT
jgi:hypothetical protein